MGNVMVKINDKEVGIAREVTFERFPLLEPVIEPLIEIKGFLENKNPLTENQTLVFDWLVIEGVHSDLLEMISELAFLNSTGGKMKWKRVSNAWLGLSDKERYEVLIAFAQRGFKKC